MPLAEKNGFLYNRRRSNALFRRGTFTELWLLSFGKKCKSILCLGFSNVGNVEASGDRPGTFFI